MTAADVPGAGPAPVVLRAVPWRVRRGQVIGSFVQDVPVVAALLGAGVTGLARRGAGGWADLTLAVAEVAVSVWLLASTMRELRHVLRGGRGGQDGGHHGRAAQPTAPAAGVDWPLLAGAALALVEVWQHWHATGRVKRPTLVLGVGYVLLALGGRAAIARRMRRRGPRLEVSGAGVRYRGSPRHRFRAAWPDVVSVEHAPDALRLTLHDGRSWTLYAREHEGGDALVAAAREAVAAHAPPSVRLPGATTP